MSPALHDRLDFIADLINPILALLLIGALIATSRRNSFSWLLVAGTVLSILLVYAIRFIDRRFDLWESMGFDYSTHTALAIVLITAIAQLYRRWLVFLLPIFIAYAGLMVFLHHHNPKDYHTPMDIITTAIVIAPLAWLCHLILQRRHKQRVEVQI